MIRDYVRRLSSDGLAIFLFHGVIERSTHVVRNYTRKHLPKDFFVSLLTELTSHGTPVSMDAVVEHHRTRTSFPARAFAITFDDGFANNYSVAAPILHDFSAPATFYVTTDFVNRNMMSWIDRIEYCMEATSKGRLRLPWRKELYSFSDPSEKKAVLDDIRLHVKNDRTIAVDALVHDIFAQCHVKEIFTSDNLLDRKLNWDEVRALARDPLFIVGGHSHRHAILSFLTPDALEEEVQTSIALLMQHVGKAPNHYSYPEGLAHCYSYPVISTLKKHGIVCCPTAEDGVNTETTDLFHLRRIFVT